MTITELKKCLEKIERQGNGDVEVMVASYDEFLPGRVVESPVAVLEESEGKEYIPYYLIEGTD